MKLVKSITVGLLLILSNFSIAETHIGGWISGRLTQEGSPYICDLDGACGFGIARGDTLIIEAGVTVLIPEDGGVTCWGVLITEGTEDDSITFDKAGEERWYYIVFMDTTFYDIEIQEVLFRYCRFRNWRSHDAQGFESQLILVGSNDHKPVFMNCTFEDGDRIIYTGYQYEMHECRFRSTACLYVNTRLPEVTRISNCIFEYSLGGGEGIHVAEEGPSASISNCLFYLPNRGIGITVYDSCQITNNIFMGLGSMIRVIEGPFNEDFVTPEIKNNLFFNQLGGINLQTYGDVELDEFEVLDCVNANGDSTDIFGNLFMDPYLAMEGDFPETYYLNEDSPCIDAGDPESDPDPDGTRADIGAFYYHQEVSVQPDFILHPSSFILYEPYPNPFNASTSITYQLPYPGHVSLAVYDLCGRIVETLVNERQDCGIFAATWQPESLASGLYFVRFEASNRVKMRKLVLIQ